MNKMIVAVFESEEDAFKGLTELKSLNKDGDISLYATAVVTKNSEGEVEMKNMSDQGPIGTSLGMLGGALIGMVAGPAGMMLGGMMGTMGGMFYDMDNASVDGTFVQEVSTALENDKVALIADLDEGWTTPVDSKLEAAGAMVFRRNRAEIADEQYEREIEALDHEMEDLGEEWKEASDDMKEKIQAQMENVKKKTEALKGAVQKKSEHIKAESNAKLEKLNEQMKTASDRKKKKLDKRIDAINASLIKRTESLDRSAAKLGEMMESSFS